MVLDEWLQSHLDDPYPTPSIKKKLAKEANLSNDQVINWFIVARKRLKYPKKHRKIYFSKENKKILQSFFNINARPGPSDITSLAIKTNETEKRIKLWFTKERFFQRKRNHSILDWV